MPSKRLIRLLALGARCSEARRGSLIIPPTGHGSVGDEAMIAGLAAGLADAGEGPVTVVARGGAAHWPQIPQATLRDLPKQRARLLLALIMAFRRFKNVYVVGADCLDGKYSVEASLGIFHAADVAATIGARTTITGSSFREDPSPECVEALRKIDAGVRVCSRDPRSHRRMEELSGRRCDLVADPAFLLRSSPPSEAPAELAWVHQRRHAGRVLLGVNFNRQVLSDDARSPAVEALLDAHVTALARLLDARDDVDLVFLPHDYRGAVSDRDHARTLAERLARPDRALAVTETLRASGLKHLAGLMDLVLTGRMHLAIAALDASVPVCCVVYQGKFAGLFDHFGVEPVTLSPETLTSEALFAMVCDALDRRIALREQVAAQLDRVRAMSRLNLGPPGRAERPQDA